MISIDYQSKLPLYEQVARRFQTLILKGVLEPDAQMPSVRALAVEAVHQSEYHPEGLRHAGAAGVYLSGEGPGGISWRTAPRL